LLYPATRTLCRSAPTAAATALAFQFASTNLVWELGLVLWVLIGWQFTLAEFVGGTDPQQLHRHSLLHERCHLVERRARQHDALR